MAKLESLKISKKYLFITTENKEYQGVFLDRYEKYVTLKNVKYGAKFASLYTLPISLIARIS
mgnify:CR=1 FL=1